MSSRGYDDVKIEEIAKAADVANATFFLHFPTKASLVEAFNEQVSNKIIDRLRGFDLGALDKLELARAIILDEWTNHASVLKQFVSDAAAQDTVSFAASSASLTAVIAEIVESGQAAGDLSTDFDPDIVSQCLVAGWRAVSLEWAVSGDDARARKANRQILDLMLFGIAPRTER